MTNSTASTGTTTATEANPMSFPEKLRAAGKEGQVALSTLKRISAPWSLALRQQIARFDAQRDPAQEGPTVMFSVSGAVKLGAPVHELAKLPRLTPQEILDLNNRRAVLRAESRSKINEEARRGQQSTARELRVTWASQITPKPVPWLWVDISASNAARKAHDPFTATDIACVAPEHTWTPQDVETDGRVPCGMVSIAAGREGSGKSSFGIWLAAQVTKGTLPGAHYGTPKRVYYVATEDSWEHTLVPRLMAAGADMGRVGKVEAVTQEGASVTMSLPDDVELLTEAIRRDRVVLVVVDPLMSTIGSGLDANASRDVRRALEPLAKMAGDTEAAIVGIAHFNKATGLDALSRITGSGAFKDVARAVMVFADAGDERVFTQPKNSVGRYDLPSLIYEIRSQTVPTPTGKTSAGVFRFARVADRSVDDVLAEQRRQKRPRSPVAAFIIDYITEHADEHGEVNAAEVIEAGHAKGFTPRQITDARSRSTDPRISTRKDGFGSAACNLWKIAEQ